MGHTALSTAKVNYIPEVDITPNGLMFEQNPFPKRFEKNFLQAPYDYRHVVLTRSFYDSLLSGYLYHRMGRECWLDDHGRPAHKGWLLNNTRENWEERIHSTPTRQDFPWPPGRGRDLCTYLREEPEDHGLRVYIEWAVRVYLEPLVRFAHNRREEEMAFSKQRTFFVCYEQLINNFNETIQMFNKALFPSRSPIQMNHSHADGSGSKYSGAHATSRDLELRSRLRAKIGTLDARIFNGTIARWSDEFGCSQEDLGHSQASKSSTV